MVLLAIRQAHISRNHIANTASSLVLGLGLNQLGTHTTKRIQCEGDKNDWQSLLEKAKKGMASEDRALDAMARKLGGRIQDTIDSGIPTQLSYGFISGYCAGLAAKKAGKVAASILGLGFMCLQTLAYNGYVQVNHTKIQKSVENFFDLNKDGKIDESDGAEAYKRVLGVLQFNLPAGSGFGAGFIGGDWIR